MLPNSPNLMNYSIPYIHYFANNNSHFMFFTFEKSPSHEEEDSYTINNINWKW